MSGSASILLWRVFCAIGLLLGFTSQWKFNQPKHEGEECGRLNGQVWKCQRQSKCAALDSLRRTGTQITCSERRGIKVICCPWNVFPQRNTVSVSERKCQQYQSKACANAPSTIRSMGDILFPGAESKRKKRNENMDMLSEYASMYQVYDFEPSLYNVVDEEYFADEARSSEDEEIPFTMLFGGTEARPSEFPHAAMIGFGDPDAILWSCGGTLISERFILSAAHCAYPANLSPALWARLGDLDYNRNTDNTRPQDFEITERYVHSGYKEPAYYNDIALFKLDHDAVFDKFVAPACLRQNPKDPPGAFIATGWGKTEMHLKTTKLMEADLYLVPPEKCWKRMTEIANINKRLPSKFDNKTMICAWNPKKDTCSGDSGGGLINGDKGDRCLAEVVGITSFGKSGCDPSKIPGVYIRVAAYVPWIESIVWPNKNQ